MGAGEEEENGWRRGCCLDKCISLDGTRNELISSLLRKITKYCHVCCFLEYCRAGAVVEEGTGRGVAREAETNAKENIKF